jgi:glycosyltransferase involved in cell wall biosynthesis
MKASRRIAVVSAFPPGILSLNEYAFHMVKTLALREDIAEIIVIADRLSNPQAELDMGPKVTVRRVWNFNSVSAMPSIITALRNAKVEGAIWNLQTATFGDKEIPAALGLMGPVFAKLLGVPSGIIAHNIIAGVDLEQTVLKGKPLRQTVVRVAGAIVTRAMMMANYVTVTLASYETLLKHSYPRADLTLVPHGTFDTELRAWQPINTRAKNIATMGKFGTYKRLETLLTAFDMLREDPALHDTVLVIGGTDHPNTKGYMASVEASRVGDKGVVFHGYVAEDDIPSFFTAARVSVFDYSSTTGSSGVLHQTASYGAVPVFPHIGDFVDVCADEGLTGKHYEPGDAAGMAAAMRGLLLDEAESERIALSNRDAAEGMPFSKIMDFHMQKFQKIHQPRG